MRRVDSLKRSPPTKLTKKERTKIANFRNQTGYHYKPCKYQKIR